MTVTVSKDDDNIRLDKWLKRHNPMPYSLLQKLLRKGAIKVDGKKAKADQRLKTGQEIRLPVIEERERPKKRRIEVSDRDVQEKLLDNVLFENKHVVVINKPPGLPTQGGSKVTLSVDDMLDHLQKEGNKERPRLIHRLDKDTSGILLIARSSASAAKLGEAFRNRIIKKTYFALVKGVPEKKEGKINLPLAIETEHGNKEKTFIDRENGKRAVTEYRVINRAGNELCLLEINLITGRKHQIRAHMNYIGNPVIGDGKYGGSNAFIKGLSKKMHLHSKHIYLPDFMGTTIDVEAPLPRHMRESFEFFGFEEK